MIKRLLIDIQVKSGDWKGALDDCREVVTRAAKKAIEDQASSFGSVEVSIVLANDMFVKHLNKQYRNHKPTCHAPIRRLTIILRLLSVLN